MQAVVIAREWEAVPLDGVRLDRVHTVDHEDDGRTGQLEGVADKQAIPVLLGLDGVAQGGQHNVGDEGRVQTLITLELQRIGAGQHGELSAAGDCGKTQFIRLFSGNSARTLYSPEATRAAVRRMATLNMLKHGKDQEIEIFSMCRGQVTGFLNCVIT